MKIKHLLTESTETSILQVIQQHLKNGEILNPEFKRLYDQTRHQFEKDCRATKEVHMNACFRGNDDVKTIDVYYAWPWDSLNNLGKFEKTVNALAKELPRYSADWRPKLQAMITDAQGLIGRWKAVAAGLKELKGKAVKVTTKRAEAKVEQQAKIEKKFNDSSVLIELFQDHMQEYLNHARKYAEAFVAGRLKVLEDHGWDLQKAAPSPNSRTMGRSEYMASQERRQLYYRLTRDVESGPRMGTVQQLMTRPEIVKPDPAGIARFIESAVTDAEMSYKAFMQKMIEKIGKPVVEASMVGNIWTNVDLTVKCNDNEVQVWNTKMIMNFSKYNKMFNQFPSRRKK